MFDERDLSAWQRGEIHTWVADPRSLSHGIDGIQKGGRIAVWMTLTWSNEIFVQTNARMVRTGQSNETTIYRLIAPKTIDEAVAEALRTKSDTQSGMFNALKALQNLVK
jgi:predicted DNA-binding transcriptional regulator AlpA